MRELDTEVRYYETVDELIGLIAGNGQGVVYHNQRNIDLLTDPDASVPVVQRVLDRQWQLARDPQVRAAMREKKGRPPVAPQQI